MDLNNFSKAKSVKKAIEFAKAKLEKEGKEKLNKAINDYNKGTLKDTDTGIFSGREYTKRLGSKLGEIIGTGKSFDSVPGSSLHRLSTTDPEIKAQLDFFNEKHGGVIQQKLQNLIGAKGIAKISEGIPSVLINSKAEGVTKYTVAEEYAHFGLAVMEAENVDGFNNLMKLAEGTSLFEEVKSDYGKRGSEKLVKIETVAKTASRIAEGLRSGETKRDNAFIQAVKDFVNWIDGKFNPNSTRVKDYNISKALRPLVDSLLSDKGISDDVNAVVEAMKSHEQGVIDEIKASRSTDGFKDSDVDSSASKPKGYIERGLEKIKNISLKSEYKKFLEAAHNLNKDVNELKKGLNLTHSVPKVSNELKKKMDKELSAAKDLANARFEGVSNAIGEAIQSAGAKGFKWLKRNNVPQEYVARVAAKGLQGAFDKRHLEKLERNNKGFVQYQDMYSIIAHNVDVKRFVENYDNLSEDQILIMQEDAAELMMVVLEEQGIIDLQTKYVKKKRKTDSGIATSVTIEDAEAATELVVGANLNNKIKTSGDTQYSIQKYNEDGTHPTGRKLISKATKEDLQWNVENSRAIEVADKAQELGESEVDSEYRNFINYLVGTNTDILIDNSRIKELESKQKSLKKEGRTLPKDEHKELQGLKSVKISVSAAVSEANEIGDRAFSSVYGLDGRGRLNNSNSTFSNQAAKYILAYHNAPKSKAKALGSEGFGMLMV